MPVSLAGIVGEVECLGIRGTRVLEQAVQIATLAGVLLTAAGIFIAIYVYRRQMNAQLFLEYTRRYEELMRSFPDDACGCRLHLEGEPPPQSDALTSAVLRYLNLCSEAELERTLRSTLVRREWQSLAGEFEAYAAFSSYVRQVQQSGGEGATSQSLLPLGGGT